MILTVTMNPSIDIAYQLDELRIDHAVRAKETLRTPGGKGLNVTRVLHTLHEDVCAAGLIGGNNGGFIKDRLKEAGIRFAFTEIKGETRCCIALLHEGKQTEVLEPGPEADASEYREFLKQFYTLSKDSSCITISGSLPAGIPDHCYADLISAAAINSVPVVLDCSGNALKKALAADHKPYAIKPNTDELAELLSRQVTKDTSSLKAALLSPLFDGIHWIIVSLGKDGCFAKHDNTFYQVRVPQIHAVSPVGSGDSMVAGIASALARNMNDEGLLKHANTLGMLNAMQKQTGCVNLNDYDALYQLIEIRKA